jgi:hypothetical protein
LTNIDNELYCYSNEFHSHLPFDRLWFTSLLFDLYPLQNITKLRLENSRQKFSPTKNSLQNLTYFRNVISNPVYCTIFDPIIMYCTVSHDMVWYCVVSLVCYGMEYGMVWYGIVWYGMV